MLAEVEGIERIRFMTSHPKDLSDKLIGAFRDCDKLCKYIHLPVQSGSDAVLKAMNRKYDRKRYFSLVEKLRDAVPDIAISTDIIVGFRERLKRILRIPWIWQKESAMIRHLLFIFHKRGYSCGQISGSDTGRYQTQQI